MNTLRLARRHLLLYENAVRCLGQTAFTHTGQLLRFITNYMFLQPVAKQCGRSYCYITILKRKTQYRTQTFLEINPKKDGNTNLILLLFLRSMKMFWGPKARPCSTLTASVRRFWGKTHTHPPASKHRAWCWVASSHWGPCPDCLPLPPPPTWGGCRCGRSRAGSRRSGHTCHREHGPRRHRKREVCSRTEPKTRTLIVSHIKWINNKRSTLLANYGRREGRVVSTVNQEIFISTCTKFQICKFSCTNLILINIV